MDEMAQDLPFLLREQAKDRVEEFKAEQAKAEQAKAEQAKSSGEDGDADVADAEEDRLAPGAGQMEQEHQRLRHAAEIAEKAYRRAEAEGGPG